MFVAPGTLPELGHRLSHDAAESIARNWWKLLLNGLLLIVAGVLIFSIEWSVRSLSTFLGVVFIVEGLMMAITTGIDHRVRQTNVVSGMLSIAAGIAIIVWPEPGIVALGIFLGSWLIIVGTLTISAAFAARHVIKDWWLYLITGLLEVPLGVLALANPGDTLAALITVGGIFAVAIGVLSVVYSFEVRHLPEDVDRAWADAAKAERAANGAAKPDSVTKPGAGRGVAVDS
jgi:uncharacterized membrane protein HdeD (DUF308 family)